MRVWRLRVLGSLVLPVALWLGALPVAAHPTIDVANPNPNDRVIAGSLVMEGVAYDHDVKSGQGSGVDQVWVRVCGDGPFLGNAVLGLPSTVSVEKGDPRYVKAGWKLTVVLKGAGELRDLCVTARSSVTGTETLLRIPITVGTKPPAPVENPTPALTGPGTDTNPNEGGPPDPSETAMTGGAGTGGTLSGTGTGGTPGGTGTTGGTGTGTSGAGIGEPVPAGVGTVTETNPEE